MIRVRLAANGAYWLARWSIGGKGRGQGLGRRDCVSRDDALRRCVEIESGLNGQPDETAALRRANIAAWVEEFLTLRPRIGQRTANLYRLCGKKLAGFLPPGANIGQVTALDAMRFSAHLTGDLGLNDYTAYRTCAEARAMFQCAMDAGILAKNPFGQGAMPQKPVPDRHWHYVDAAQLEKLLEVAPAGWRVFLGLIRLAGLRRHEALELRWADIDLAGRRVTVCNQGRYQTTKQRTRQVPIGPRLHDLLFEASMCGDVTDVVCQGLAGGSVDQFFAVLCRRAGLIPWDRPCQACRKSLETDWCRRYPMHVTAAFLGNSPKIAMAHYTKPLDGDFEAISGGQAGQDRPVGGQKGGALAF